MTQHADILDSQEPVRGAFVGAVGLHVTIVLTAVLVNWMGRSEPLGAPDVAGGAVPVQAVNTIPIPHHGPTNPLANDSKSEAPLPAVSKPIPRVQKEIPKPDAVPLKMKTPKKVADKPQVVQHYRSYQALENQVTTREAPQVSTPMYSAQQGSGNVGTGANTTLGTRCAAYATQIQQIVARNWNTTDVDARYTTAPVVIATFDLMRDGGVRSLAVLQGSGITALDFSVQRAIRDSHFPPIPPCAGFDKNYATVEFWFELKR
ncbi:MAG TPA: TonB C-terminal domain-containing protein [Bryobacteraceae bacterium]|nr:TonB C-terminal domain-containing protein [Bryobacteraceae bacterium]